MVCESGFGGRVGVERRGREMGLLFVCSLRVSHEAPGSLLLLAGMCGCDAVKMSCVRKEFW